MSNLQCNTCSTVRYIALLIIDPCRKRTAQRRVRGIGSVTRWTFDHALLVASPSDPRYANGFKPRINGVGLVPTCGCRETQSHSYLRVISRFVLPWTMCMQAYFQPQILYLVQELTYRREMRAKEVLPAPKRSR